MVRYLTADLHTLSVNSSERAAILKLRQLIPQFSRSEATALATILVHSYSIVLGRWVGISATQNFNKGLTTAVLQVSSLSPLTKLGIGIELLKIEAQGEDIDADPYGYITPALDEDEEDDSGLSKEFKVEEDDE